MAPPQAQDTLTPTLNSIQDLFGKLQRESYWAYWTDKEVHKADHLYNFCITVHSMKDYFFEHKRIVQESDKQFYHNKWAQNPLLVAASEIANKAKHFMLRKPKTGDRKDVKTQAVKQKESGFVDIYLDEQGNIWDKFVMRQNYSIVLEDGQEFELYDFTEQVLKDWQTFLESHSIKIQPQEVSDLLPSFPFCSYGKEKRKDSERG